MGSSDSQIDKPQRGRPKWAELPDVNRNTGAQSINTERTSSSPGQTDLQVDASLQNRQELEHGVAKGGQTDLQVGWKVHASRKKSIKLEFGGQTVKTCVDLRASWAWSKSMQVQASHYKSMHVQASHYKSMYVQASHYKSMYVQASHYKSMQVHVGRWPNETQIQRTLKT